MKLAQKLALSYIRARLNLLATVSKKRAAAKAFEIFCTPMRRSSKRTPPIFEKAESLHFSLEGVTVRGHRWNHPQKNKLLIVHGFESSSVNFDRYISPLVKKGYEVMVFDAPAHGSSGGKTINLPMYVRTLRKINELFGPIQNFMGHSFGGLAITQFAESQPHTEKFKIVLIAPATETTTAIDSFFKLLQLNDGVRKEFDSIILEKGGVPPEHYSVRRALKHIQSQVLWLHDEDDDMTPLSDALKVKDDKHRQLEFVVTKGLGHRRIYRDNKVVKKVFEFFELP